jgi:hypothetical protein
MSSVLSAFVVWLLASIPFALCVGWFCSLNQLSLDENAAPILESALGALRPDAHVASA